MNDETSQALHDRQVAAIMIAVSNMLPTFKPQGFSPEAIFEGALKGAAAVMMTGRDLSALDIADLLDGFATGFRANPRLDRGKLHVVE